MTKLSSILHNRNLKADIAETFISIQGEGSWAGRPAFFIRFAGCNLSCSLCDTDYSHKYTETVQNLVKQANEHLTPYVVITGGEPTAQPQALLALAQALKLSGKRVSVETNCTNAIPREVFDLVTLSPKFDVKQKGTEIITPPIRQYEGDDLKVLYYGQQEGELDLLRSKFDVKRHYLQPVSCDPELTSKAFNIVAKSRGWRLSIQIQKYIKVR